MSEQRYTQGMARPDVDIGTRDVVRKPVGERTTLVTGGSGFIGGHLVRELLDTGRTVVTLDVQPFTPEARFVIGPDVDSLPLELASIGDQARVLDVFRVHRPDEVVHAGMILDPAYLATNRATAFQVNLGGVINLVEAMIAFGVPRLVNFSSVGVLPRVMYEPIDSNHPILLADAGPATDFYGSTKAAAETMLFAYHQALGFDFRTIRPSAVYGLGMNQYVGPIKAMVEHSVRGEPAHFEFGGSHPRPYTHARDIAGLVVAMLDAPGRRRPHLLRLDGRRDGDDDRGGGARPGARAGRRRRDRRGAVRGGEARRRTPRPALDRERADAARVGAALRCRFATGSRSTWSSTARSTSRTADRAPWRTRSRSCQVTGSGPRSSPRRGACSSACRR